MSRGRRWTDKHPFGGGIVWLIVSIFFTIVTLINRAYILTPLGVFIAIASIRQILKSKHK